MTAPGHGIAPPEAAGFAQGAAAPVRVSAILEWAVAAAACALAGLTAGADEVRVILAVTLAALPLVGWIVVQDLRCFTIADGAVASLAILALAARHAASDPPLVLGADLMMSGGVLLAFREIYFRRRGFDGLGLGDVKLAAAGGLLVGAPAFAWALLGASLATLGAAGALLVAQRLRGRAADLAGRKLAFGAALAPALLAAWMVQQWPLLWTGGA